MPGQKSLDRATRANLAEDIEYKIRDAAGAAEAMAAEVANGTNPAELSNAWQSIADDLKLIGERAKKLAC